jgi:hypothetical protein
MDGPVWGGVSAAWAAGARTRTPRKAVPMTAWNKRAFMVGLLKVGFPPILPEPASNPLPFARGDRPVTDCPLWRARRDTPRGIGGPRAFAEDRRMDASPTLDPQALADRYIALWTEPDDRARRAEIRALWAPGGAHVLHPPAEVVKIAAELGFGSPALEAHGHAAIETRVSRSYDRFVATGEFTFRARGGAVRLGPVVKFEWSTVRAADDTVVGGGLEVLLLDENGAISRDTMFPG